MKILQINTVCGTGSIGRFTIDIYNKAIEAGHECIIAYGRGSMTTNVNTYHIGNNLDVYSHFLHTRLVDKHGFASINATKKLINYIKEYHPDIIQLHNIHGYYLNIQILFKFLKDFKKPIFWTMQDCWAFTGHCAYYDYVNCSKWKKECYNCPQKNSYPKSLFFDSSRNNFIKKKELFLNVDNMEIIAASNWLAMEIQKSFFREYKINMIHNGIDFSSFKPKKDKTQVSNFSGKFVMLGVASTWDRRKGLVYFIKLSKMLSQEFQIILIGLSEKQINKLPENIIGIKRTNSKSELADLYSSADLFLNFTLEDTFPTTNLEALACGTPVLTFNTGGSPEAIDETCGFVVEKGEMQAVIDVIYKVKNGPDMSEACIKRAQLFKNDDKFQEYIDLYEQKIAKTPNGI